MTVDCSSPLPLKRRRLTNADPMETESAKVKLAVAKEKFGREIHVFETSSLSSSPSPEPNSEEPDDFYEFTEDDYYRILSTEKEDTNPPKKLIKDMSQDFHTAAFVPGAIVYFAYDVPNGDDTADGKSGPFHQEELISLKDLEFVTEQVECVETAPVPVAQAAPPAVEECKPADKKPVKPKWL